MERIATIILAAGKGTRMKSDLVKVLHPLLGLPMLSYTIDLALGGIHSEKTIVVVGYQADQIKERFKDPRIQFVFQEEQLGTGHAVLQAFPFLKSFDGTVLILCGDVPLVKVKTLLSFIEAFKGNESALSVLTAIVEEPFGYGRILRSPEGWLDKIVEEKDASEEERMIREVNTGIFCIKSSFLFNGLREIGLENAQSEYYLTDLVEIARRKGLRCSAHKVVDPVEVMGINTQVDLGVANEVLRQEKARGLMLSGVTVVDPGIGKGSKANHPAYTGDSLHGEGVNIGAGTAIAEDIPERRLTIRRVSQKNIRGWNEKMGLHRKEKIRKKG